MFRPPRATRGAAAVKQAVYLSDHRCMLAPMVQISGVSRSLQAAAEKDPNLRDLVDKLRARTAANTIQGDLTGLVISAMCRKLGTLEPGSDLMDGQQASLVSWMPYAVGVNTSESTSLHNHLVRLGFAPGPPPASRAEVPSASGAAPHSAAGGNTTAGGASRPGHWRHGPSLAQPAPATPAQSIAGQVSGRQAGATAPPAASGSASTAARQPAPRGMGPAQPAPATSVVPIAKQAPSIRATAQVLGSCVAMSTTDAAAAQAASGSNSTAPTYMPPASSTSHAASAALPGGAMIAAAAAAAAAAAPVAHHPPSFPEAI
ncbi:hypothetical protein ABBQ38_007746 [Trebouxia sp. C0009 RCD-2024]